MRHEMPPPSVRVLVVDDTRVHTQLLADALKRDGCLQVTTLPGSSDGLAARLAQEDTDVLLMSCNLEARAGYGFEVLRGMRKSRPEMRAVMLLDASKGEMILEAFRAGARGIFSKDDPVDMLSKCLLKVHEGQIWANVKQIETLVQALASSHNIRAVDARGLNLLSKREMDVVRGVALGLSNREIAEQLNLSQHTIKNSLFRIFDKLGVSSRVELLFMTLSQERHAESAVQSFLNQRAFEALRDEATLVACQAAADQGVLIAQIALAQYYTLRKDDLGSAIQAYVWYSIANEQIAQGYKQLAKELTIEQLLSAERMAADRLKQKKEVTDTPAKSKSILRRSPGETARAASSGAAG